MANVSYTVPSAVKDSFEAAFASENKSAVIARLMRQAVEERCRHGRRAAAIDRLLAIRRQQAPASDEEIAQARRVGRPWTRC